MDIREWVGWIFSKATLDSTGKWNVENMKAPINSSGDDFGITFAGNKESGFLVPIAMMRVDRPFVFFFRIAGYHYLYRRYRVGCGREPDRRCYGPYCRKGWFETKSFGKERQGKYRVELERDIRYVMMASARGYLNQNF